ncbi:MAG: DUF2946 family protein [Burkholderiales bacterium]
MDEMVARSLAKWPNVPAVYGWLSLDRRGNWLIRSAHGATPRFERIGNAALREFIGRNYAADERGCWFFQNGPQRVFVSLAYTPLVVHHEGDRLVDHCGRPYDAGTVYQDDEGSVLIAGEGAIALLDDRDLARYAEGAAELPRIAKAEVPQRFGFVQLPAVSLRRP